MKLIIEDDEGRKTVVPVLRDEITIGRNEQNLVRLAEKNVSRRHGRLLREQGEYYTFLAKKSRAFECPGRVP